MKLTYILDYVFFRTPDDRVWTDTSYEANFWKPYLAIYDHVELISRVRDVAEHQPAWKQVNSDSVNVAAVPHYNGPLEYLRKASTIRAVILASAQSATAVALRIPSNLSRCAASLLHSHRIPFIVDVVGDPRDAMAKGVVRMRGRAYFRWVFTRSQRRICKQAAGVAYVAGTIATRYPAHVHAPTLTCTDVRLPAEWLAPCDRKHPGAVSKLITVATLSQTYKGIDVLLDAVARCRQQGKLFTLSIVGTGRYQSELEQLAQTLGIAGQVQFTGAVPWGPRLMELLDSAEMFVLPSRVEVMPRALLEAMARALPVLATAVGAVPEVVPAACLSMPGNAEQLSEMLMRITEKPALLDAMSSMNLKIASHKTEDFVIPALQSFHRDCLAHFHQTPAASQLQPSAA